jgi:hypothetical protein
LRNSDVIKKVRFDGSGDKEENPRSLSIKGIESNFV